MSIDTPLSQEDLHDLVSGLLDWGLVPSLNGKDFQPSLNIRIKELKSPIEISKIAPNTFNISSGEARDFNPSGAYTVENITKRLQQDTIVEIAYVTKDSEITSDDGKQLISLDSYSRNGGITVFPVYFKPLKIDKRIVELLPNESKMGAVQRTVVPRSGRQDYDDDDPIILSEVPLANREDPKSRNGEEYRWFLMRDDQGNVYPLTVRYWLNGTLVTQEEYQLYTREVIDKTTGLVPDLAKLSSSYI